MSIGSNDIVGMYFQKKESKNNTELTDIIRQLALKVRQKQRKMVSDEEKLAKEMREKVRETTVGGECFKLVSKKQKRKVEGEKKRDNISNIDLDFVLKNRQAKFNPFANQKQVIRSNSSVLRKLNPLVYKKKYQKIDPKKLSKNLLKKKYLYKSPEDILEASPSPPNQNTSNEGYLSFYKDSSKFEEFGIDYYMWNNSCSNYSNT